MHYARMKKHGDLNYRRPPSLGTIDKAGYHLKMVGDKYVPVHVSMAEKALGHPLPVGAEVHHANGKRADNRNENLVICPGRAYHSLLHQRMRALAACGNANWRKCYICKTYDDPVNLYIHDSAVCHRRCKSGVDVEYARIRWSKPLVLA